ncbi:hypothetical protein Tel_01635 [Candidatus Tenderia electrophaga]|jgi:hypothetical protein|uniref:STAS/SEC14 domain-containing protein n=1 Tax=Candidatus Tenderia electrophaga TaxID=1748243 RepID=A0A0S2T9X1_9GAMM|nr:hypothetical protein Tel_01635 [Candidatus Tenderia electrophaga]
MAIQVNYIDGGVGVEILFSGFVSGTDILRYRGDLYTPERLDKQRYQLIDRSQCQKYFVSNGDIKRIAEIDAQAAAIKPGIVIAIVSPSEMLQRAAEIWKSYLDKAGFVVALFDDRNAAIAWIESRLGAKIPLD